MNLKVFLAQEEDKLKIQREESIIYNQDCKKLTPDLINLLWIMKDWPLKIEDLLEDYLN